MPRLRDDSAGPQEGVQALRRAVADRKRNNRYKHLRGEAGARRVDEQADRIEAGGPFTVHRWEIPKPLRPPGDPDYAIYDVEGDVMRRRL